MRADRAIAIAVILAFSGMAGLGAWLLSGTPGTLVNEAPPVLGPAAEADGEPVILVVAPGETASDVAENLAAAGVIESSRLFRVLASLMGVGDDLIAGEYEFRRGETALTTVRRISQGHTSPLVVTVLEGLRVEEIAELLERRNVVSGDEFKRALGDQYSGSFLEALPPATALEGFLFPATYGFSRTAGGHEVVQLLLDAFDQRYREEILPRLVVASSDLTLLQIVTLASIIEREARVAEERPLIASVFINRLEAGFLLQADPTVQYAVGSDPASSDEFGYWKRELTLADLAIDSPYNTYVSVGLPPGPIANPGLDSLLAALEPADTNFLFFVACDDGSGRHAFAETLEEHNLNVSQSGGGECPE